MPRRPDPASELVAAPVGAGLGRAFGAVARVRGRKAIHPRGAVLAATMHRWGLRPGSGVSWIDSAGDLPVLVRFSRSVGLPPPLPDVFGLSLRFAAPDGAPADLLLSSGGRGRLGRHVLAPGRDPRRAAYSTLVPYRGPRGSVLLGARPSPSGTALLVSLGRGPWREFGRLELPDAATAAPDQDVDFDAVLHPLPGLQMPRWLARLRAPAYAASRSGRSRR